MLCQQRPWAVTAAPLSAHIGDRRAQQGLQGQEQGSAARISICTPVDDYILTAMDADGSEVPVFSRTQYMSPRVASRLVFPNR